MHVANMVSFTFKTLAWHCSNGKLKGIRRFWDGWRRCVKDYEQDRGRKKTSGSVAKMRRLIDPGVDLNTVDRRYKTSPRYCYSVVSRSKQERLGRRLILGLFVCPSMLFELHAQSVIYSLPLYYYRNTRNDETRIHNT